MSHVNMIVGCEGNSTKGLNGGEGQRRAEQCGETGVSASGKHEGNMPENTQRARRTSQAEHPQGLSHRARRRTKTPKPKAQRKGGLLLVHTSSA